MLQKDSNFVFNVYNGKLFPERKVVQNEYNIQNIPLLSPLMKKPSVNVLGRHNTNTAKETEFILNAILFLSGEVSYLYLHFAVLNEVAGNQTFESWMSHALSWGYSHRNG